MSEVTRKIVCAAVRVGTFVVLGPRHYSQPMHEQIKWIESHTRIPWKKLRQSYGEEQGFIDQFGQFYDRKQAMELVKSNGQPFDLKRNGGSGDELYSEGLY
ncbi:hypothetical protein [Paraferrimonas sedimenticola]|uniref:Uncharacterized protein n=1 Tax=Paraferrimonas sedimenticola TaxID=375674 RepID=A0AA37RSP2_9GAMM|nr:hypothetical protein [Paraferrimonas sedimenticola]GLP95303.1 hypothetical protein GCM10007895_06090 [Paraferrimonas sedimenticola]